MYLRAKSTEANAGEGGGGAEITAEKCSMRFTMPSPAHLASERIVKTINTDTVGRTGGSTGGSD